MNTENKWPINGFAPGSYQCKCAKCENMFIGDKRAVRCEGCATEGIQWDGADWLPSPPAEITEPEMHITDELSRKGQQMADALFSQMEEMFSEMKVTPTPAPEPPANPRSRYESFVEEYFELEGMKEDEQVATSYGSLVGLVCLAVEKFNKTEHPAKTEEVINEKEVTKILFENITLRKFICEVTGLPYYFNMDDLKKATPNNS